MHRLRLRLRRSFRSLLLTLLIRNATGQLKLHRFAGLWVTFRVKGLQKRSGEVHVEALFFGVRFFTLLGPLLDESLLQKHTSVTRFDGDVDTTIAHTEERIRRGDLQHLLLGVHVGTTRRSSRCSPTCRDFWGQPRAPLSEHFFFLGRGGCSR